MATPVSIHAFLENARVPYTVVPQPNRLLRAGGRGRQVPAGQGLGQGRDLRRGRGADSGGASRRH